MPDGIYVWIVATHSDRPINNRIYKAEEMRKQVATWTHPYSKPVLRHHDDRSDPVGRVVEQLYAERNRWPLVKEQLGFSDTVPFPEDQTGQLLVKQYITDPDAIQKIKDGRYQTVSVGFTAEHLYCSICGHDWQTGEACKHQLGHEYEGQVMYLVPEGITYKEISFVNQPADEYAVVVKHYEEHGSVVIPNATFRILLKDFAPTTQQNDSPNVSHVAETAEHSPTSNQEVENMEEVKINRESEYEALKKQYQELQDRYNQILNSLKAGVIEEILDIKQWLGHTYSDEQLQQLRQRYEAMSLETLNAIKSELEDECELISKFLQDSQTEECKPCEQKQPEQTSEPQKASNPVEFVHNASETRVEYDALTIVKKILGIGGDSK